MSRLDENCNGLFEMSWWFKRGGGGCEREESSAGLIPKNLGIAIDLGFSKNTFFIVRNQFFFTIPWLKMANKNRFSIPRTRN